MKLPIALANWIADSEGSHGQSFEDWAPDGFDWRAFCADAPAFAERLGERFPAATAPAAKARLEELATAAFRGAYVATLCVYSAYDAGADPDEALGRLAQPLTASEIGPFTDAVAADLDEVEAALGANPADDDEDEDGDVAEDEDTAGASPAPSSPAARRVIALARSAREVVRETLAPGLRSAARALVSLGVRAETTSRILSGVVNVATAVAAFRYVTASEAAVAEGGEPPAYDPELLAAATGRAPRE
jgi:hypothetical protein